MRRGIQRLKQDQQLSESVPWRVFQNKTAAQEISLKLCFPGRSLRGKSEVA